MRPCDTSYLLRQFVGVGYDKYLIFLTIFNIWYHWLGLTWRWEQTATWPLSYKSRLLYAGPDSPEIVWLGFVLKFYTLLSVRELGSLYSHLLLPDPVRKATSSLSSLTYIVSTETNQQSFCKWEARAGCEDWLWRGTTSHWGFMIRSLENSNQDWLLPSFHWLDNNSPITQLALQSCSLPHWPDVWCVLYWSGRVGQWGDDRPTRQLLVGEHWQSRESQERGWHDLYSSPVQQVAIYIIKHHTTPSQ